MTIVFEVAKPWQWKPGRFGSTLMRRAWWGPFGVTLLSGSLYDYTERVRTGDTDWIKVDPSAE